MSLENIAYCRIFPSIGIARVGNSPDDFFVGPELTGVPVDNGGSYKDAEGRVKRQAARFRLYAFDDQGQVSGELNADHPEVEAVEWHVELANRKADWYQFAGAERVAEILAGNPPQNARRNARVKPEQRQSLIVGPLRQTVSGREQRTDPMQGRFAAYDRPEATVTLGELRTDAAGRLLVLGGLGDSDTVLPDNPLKSYANNDGWHDDTSDGPVTAVVRFRNGQSMEARGRAWVISPPPHFSPHTQNVVTLYDAMEEAVRRHNLAWPENELGPVPDYNTVSFTRDIYPILRRLSDYQWTSDRARRGHSQGRKGGFLTDELLAVLADPQEAAKPESLAKRIFRRVRTPMLHPPFVDNPPADTISLHPDSQEAANQANLSFMPPLAGDEGDVVMGDASSWLSLTETQYRKLAQWQAGQFVGDWTSPPQSAYASLEAAPLGEQPRLLLRAGLEACQGGAFFPGIEATSIIRFASFYSEAFRVSDTYAAGDITRWMALPWQADFYECRDHWWPAIRPDAVVTEEEYDRIQEKFGSETTQGRAASLLVNRQPWARGLDWQTVGKPGLPDPEDGETPATYQARATTQLQRFADAYGRVVPRPVEDELPALYIRRVQEFLDQTILEQPVYQLPPLPKKQSLPDYYRSIRETLAAFFAVQINPSPPKPDETLKQYYWRLQNEAASNTVWQGLFNVEWGARNLNRGKMDLVANWNQLGFVVPRTQHGETVLVETDRKRFDLLSFRDYFYYLMNIEEHPEFLPKARALAEDYLSQSRAIQPTLDFDPTVEQYAPFEYDPITFGARLEKIYEHERRAAEDYNPAMADSEPVFRTPDQIVQRIVQLAPFNQLDGSWLEHIAKSGPIEEIRSFLFDIWSDEIGNGDPARNHANVYTHLLQSAGIYLPPLNSRAYADNPAIWEESFTSPVYQTAISLFPDTYYPELLGMTLYLEWEAIFLPAMVKLYEYHHYPSLFYRLHVAIDNPVNGHGAKARDAVILYLDHVMRESGEKEMQAQWQRVWDGYIAFKFVGGGSFEYQFSHPDTLDDRMVDMIARKSHYAQLNHGTRRLGPNSINDWFDEPDQFLNELANSDLIVKGEARKSPFLHLFDMDGPMLKVFTAQEQELWVDWINSLPPDQVGGALDAGKSMEVLIEQFRARAMGVPEHGTFTLAGSYLDPQTGQMTAVEKPVSWWFQIGQPEQFMQALANPANGWIIPGNAAESRFVRELVADTGLMSQFLSHTVPELGDKPARDVIIDWIQAGCPMPAAPQPTFVDAATPRTAQMRMSPRVTPRMVRNRDMEDHQPLVVARSVTTVRATPEQRKGLLRRFYGPGGGAAH